MDTNTFNLWWLVLVIPLLMGCPFEDDKCFNDWERITTLEDLIVIDPFSDTFFLDQVVKFQLTIPDSIYFLDTKLSLFKETGDQFPKLITDNRLFLNNSLNFEYGYQGDKDNWFHLEYIPEDEVYTLKILVRFNNTGNFELANTSSGYSGDTDPQIRPY